MNRLQAVRAMLCAVLSVACVSVLADPPSHAKAHGWRKKNDPNYAGYRGKTWERDYGIVSMGRCDTDAVLGVAGAAIGGVVGAKASEGADEASRAVAIILGTAVGAVVGSKIGRQIDRTDRACIGHALELAAVGKTVRWDNEHVHYELTPVRNVGSNCREFKLKAARDKVSESATRVACSAGNGAWELKS